MSFVASIRAAAAKIFSPEYLAPTVVGGAIAFLVSTGFNVYNAVDKTTQESQQQAATFSKVLTDTILTSSNAFNQNSTIFDEQKATVALMALDGMAITEQERRTVLYIGARLLTASSTRADTGGPGARFLDVSIGRLKSDVANSDIKAESKRLLSLVRSDGFIDMAAAGYSTQYYNDYPQISDLQPTLFGDQPISSAAKLSVLVDIGPDLPNGWIHLASWRTSLHADDWQAADAAAAAPDVTSSALDQYDDYALLNGKTVKDAQPAKLADWLALTGSTLILSRPRLARASAPLVTYAGTMHAGTLGRVIGAIAPLQCVDLVEAPKPVLVFVDDKLLGKKSSGLSGLIHLWGHVQARAACP